MSRTLASAIALFAASVLVFTSALMLAFGPITKPSPAPMPAVLNQVEPQSGSTQVGSSRPGRLSSDMTATIRSMEARAEVEAGPKQPANEAAKAGTKNANIKSADVVDLPTLQTQPYAASITRRPGWQPEPSPPGKTPAAANIFNQAAVNPPGPKQAAASEATAPQAGDTASLSRQAPPARGPSPKLLSRLNPGAGEPGQAPQDTQAAYEVPDLSSGSGPISLLPRRGVPAASASTGETASMPAAMPRSPRPAMQQGGTIQRGAVFQPGALNAQPNYAPAPTPAPGQGPSFIPQSSAEEANMTADQLNERELQRLKRWREMNGGGAQ